MSTAAPGFSKWQSRCSNIQADIRFHFFVACTNDFEAFFCRRLLTATWAPSTAWITRAVRLQICGRRSVECFPFRIKGVSRPKDFRLQFHRRLHFVPTTNLLSEVAKKSPCQEFLGQQDVRTTRFYTHALNQSERGVRSQTNGLRVEQ